MVVNIVTVVLRPWCLCVIIPCGRRETSQQVKSQADRFSGARTDRRGSVKSRTTRRKNCPRRSRISGDVTKTPRAAAPGAHRSFAVQPMPASSHALYHRFTRDAVTFFRGLPQVVHVVPTTGHCPLLLSMPATPQCDSDDDCHPETFSCEPECIGTECRPSCLGISVICGVICMFIAICRW